MKDILCLSWDEYFMGIAIFTSLRSKDPNSKVGAVIINRERHIVGTGYNGFVAGADESVFNWEREGEWLKTKYPFVVHAEANAILNSTSSDLRTCTMYSTLHPCNECAKKIAQKGISEVVYISDKYRMEDFHRASKMIFKASGVKTRQITGVNLENILKKFREYIP